MTLPAAVADLVRGRPTAEAPSDEQAFPFVTVDERGYPHFALLSRSEVEVAPSDHALLAAIASPRTRANLDRDGRAALMSVGHTSAHYVKLRVALAIEAEGLGGYALEVDEHKEDSLGIPLSGTGFRATAEVARMERWDRSARILQQLAESYRP